MKIKSENFLSMQGWMRTELGLKGNDLIVYAIIYGFSQTEKQKYTEGLQYLADWCGATKQGIIKNINNLIETGLIEKFEIVENGIKFCEYSSTPLNLVEYRSTKLNTVELSSMNNIYNNTINNNIKINNTEKIIKKDNKIQDKGGRVKNFVDAYHANCPNLPKVRCITDKRKQAISKIIKKYSTDDILIVLKNANDSSFLIGNNDRGWKADIDFILREDKFVSILEGKYNDRKSSSRSKLHETGAKHVESFTKEDEEHLREFQSKLRKEGKRVVF